MNIATARQLKQEGNSFVAQQDYQKALSKYTKIFAYINGLTDHPSMASVLANSSPGLDASLPKPTSPQIAEVAELKLAANSNIALCYLKLRRPEKAIQFATEVLKGDANNLKALFRRGQAYLDLGDIDNASKDLDAALKLAPSDPAIRQAQVALKEKIRQIEAKQREQFKGMFDRKQHAKP
jgi:tetratricopeptide (TPR) repeat protein